MELTEEKTVTALAKQIITNFCTGEGPTTRKLMVPSLCSKHHWDLVSQAMEITKIKKNRQSFSFQPSEEAIEPTLRWWNQMTFWVNDELHARTSGENQYVNVSAKVRGT
jgi:hypothetical protein